MANVKDTDDIEINTREQMKQKRILYIEGNVDGTVGGSYYVLYDLILNLDKKRYCPVVVFYSENTIASKLRGRGIETHILTRPAPYILPIEPHSNILAQLLALLLRPLQRCVNLWKRLLLPSLQLRHFLKQKEIDLVNLNNSITRNHEWMLASLLAGVDCMTHEMGINNHFSRLSRFFAPRMKAIITVSNIVKTNMRKHNIDYPHVLPIHNGIDVSRYSISREPAELREHFNIPRDAPLLCVIGNIKPWKGQETVVRATELIKKELPNICCLLVGGYSSHDRQYYKQLVQLTEDLQIKNNILFTGFQDNPIDFMNMADIIIHPSIAPEPFGIVNLEAMLLRKPVISTTIGAPPEIFENRISGLLIDPEEPDTLAQECISLLHAPHKMTLLGDAAHDRLMENFTIDINVKKTEKVYAAIFAGRAVGKQ